MKIRFLGAARKVTGSCFHLLTDSTELIVDCGMNQGRNSDVLNQQPFGFEPGKLSALLLTHCPSRSFGADPEINSRRVHGQDDHDIRDG